MSPGAYLLGVLWLGTIAGALGFGAVHTRRRLLPHLDAATARLAEIILALGPFVLVPELLGAVGLFRRLTVWIGLVVVGIGAGLVARRPRGTGDPGTELAGVAARGTESLTLAEARRGLLSAPAREAPGRPGRVVTAAAMVLAAAVVAQWAGFAAATYTSTSSGIWDGDSLWYHLPFATSFVQSGWVGRPLFTNADTLVTYFPANGEVVLATVMLPFRRDALVPLVNLGWLLLAFLAAWCLGRRYGAAPVALAGTALAMSVPVMASTQAGTARNDAMGVALFLAAAALVAHADWDRTGMWVAGTAAGLALGVKLSTLIPVALLAVAVVVAAPRARRRAAIVPWASAIAVFGGFWYLRNLVLVGNPVPTVGVSLGPIELPSVFAGSIADSAVLDRLREPGAVDRVLRPGLEGGFASLWWVVVLAAAAAGLWALARGPDRVARLLGAVTLAGGMAYVIMPNGSPYGDTPLAAGNFMLNLRYLLPVLTLGLALLSVLPRMRDPRFALAAVGGCMAMAVTTIGDRDLADHWEWATSTGQALLGAGLVLLAGLVVAGIVVVLAASRSRGRAVVALVVGGIAVAGFFVQRTYYERRYLAAREGPEARVSEIWPWVRGLESTRIAVVGTLVQYPYAGPNLANTVRYVGIRQEDGGFRSVRSCREVREQLVDGRFRYLVAAHDFFGSNVREIDRIREWVGTVPGVEVVRATPAARVYEFTSPPDPHACS